MNGPCSMSQPQTPSPARIPTARGRLGSGLEVSDRPGLDHGGHAVEEAVDERQRRRDSRRRRGCGRRSGAPPRRRSTRPARRSSGTQLRASGSPVTCWWVLTKPGVTTHPLASRRSASGYCATELGGGADRDDACRRRSRSAPSRMIRRSASIVTTSPPVTSRSSRNEHLLDGELEVVAVGVGDDADVADDRVAVHRAEQQAALVLGHRRDPVDVVSGVAGQCRGG